MGYVVEIICPVCKYDQEFYLGRAHNGTSWTLAVCVMEDKIVHIESKNGLCPDCLAPTLAFEESICPACRAPLLIKEVGRWS